MSFVYVIIDLVTKIFNTASNQCMRIDNSTEGDYSTVTDVSFVACFPFMLVVGLSRWNCFIHYYLVFIKVRNMYNSPFIQQRTVACDYLQFIMFSFQQNASLILSDNIFLKYCRRKLQTLVISSHAFILIGAFVITSNQRCFYKSRMRAI